MILTLTATLQWHVTHRKFMCEAMRQGWIERMLRRGAGGETGGEHGSWLLFSCHYPWSLFQSQPHLMKVKQYTSPDYVTTGIHLLS